MTVPTVAERVQAGAAWLDEHRPDWADLIDLNWLEMSRCDRCVLGQIFGDFGKVVSAKGNVSPSVIVPMGMTFAEADQRGFSALAEEIYEEYEGTPPPKVQEAAEIEYADLAEAWREMIAARRAGGVR